MVRRLLVALFLALSAGLPAWAQGDAGALRVREAAGAIVRGNLDQAIALYNEALDDKSLPNDRRATILNDRGVAFARRQRGHCQLDRLDCDFNNQCQRNHGRRRSHGFRDVRHDERSVADCLRHQLVDRT